MEAALAAAYQHSRRRLLLLDYDGTLAPFAAHAADARPQPRLLQLLHTLCADTHNAVVIVSGRNHEELEAWLGPLPVSFIAEHGVFIREGGSWRATLKTDQRWKPPVRQAMQAAVQALHKTYVEEKSAGLVWHWRQADPMAAKAVAAALLVQLQPLARKHNLIILIDSKNIDVRPAGTDKGQAAQHWLTGKPWDFILAAGDSVTDEDLFAAMPAHAFTIKIGPGQTAAQSRLPSPRAFRALLQRLAGADFPSLQV